MNGEVGDMEIEMEMGTGGESASDAEQSVAKWRKGGGSDRHRAVSCLLSVARPVAVKERLQCPVC